MVLYARRTALSAAAVALLTLVLGCGGAGAGGGGGGADTGSFDGALGTTFTIPAGPINDWQTVVTQARAELKDLDDETVHVYGPVSTGGGSFPGLEVGPPPGDTLIAWASLEAFWEQSILNDFGVTLNLVASDTDTDAEVQFISGLHVYIFSQVAAGSWSDGADLVRRLSNTELPAVSWVFVDRDVNVTGQGSTSVVVGNGELISIVEVDLSLKEGWNLVFTTQSQQPVDSDIEVTTRFVTGSEPNDTAWYYEGG